MKSRFNPVLISSVASPTGKLLAAYFAREGVRVIGIDNQSTTFTHGVFIESPRASDKVAFTKFLFELISNEGIARAFFCNDHELGFLANLEDAFNLRGLGLPAPPVVRKFLDKQRSTQAASAFFSIPRVIAPEERPKDGLYFVRNRMSVQRPKVMRALDAGELCVIPLEERQSLLVTDFLHGREFTADTFYDPDYDICETAIRERLVVKDGVCTVARLVDDYELTQQINAFVRYNEIVGFSCTQFICVDERYHYIETNTRAGGGTSISLRAGLGDRIAGIKKMLPYGEIIHREHEDGRI